MYFFCTGPENQFHQPLCSTPGCSLVECDFLVPGITSGLEKEQPTTWVWGRVLLMNPPAASSLRRIQFIPGQRALQMPLYHPGWSVQWLTATSTSQVQAILVPQSPKLTNWDYRHVPLYLAIFSRDEVLSCWSGWFHTPHLKGNLQLEMENEDPEKGEAELIRCGDPHVLCKVLTCSLRGGGSDVNVRVLAIDPGDLAQLFTVVCGSDCAALAAKPSHPLLAFQVEAIRAVHTGFAASCSLLHSLGGASCSHAPWKLRVGEVCAGRDACPEPSSGPEADGRTESCYICWLSLVWSSWFPEGNWSKCPHNQGFSSLFR
ncbi:hypothetical protein AAY473_017333 [Plecturocebus cupreus]